MSELQETSRKLDDLMFASEKQEEFKTFDDAINNLRPYLIRPEAVDPREINFSFNGSAKIEIGNSSFNTTRFAVESLCKLLKIPNPFSQAIPLDLLQRNIGRLANVYNRGLININFDVDNNIVGFTPDAYRPLKTIDLLPYLGERFGDASQDLKIVLNTRNMFIQFTRQMDGLKLEPAVGDITKCGLEITNSELNDLDARADIFLLRLACTNGCTLSEGWGSTRRNKNNKIPYERVLEGFLQNCSALQTDYIRLGNVYNTLPDLSLNSKQLVSVNQALCGLFDKDTAARILMCDLEEIKETQAFEKKRTKWSPNPSSWYGHLPRDMSKNAYEVFNNITETARDLHNINTARKARVYSGRYLWTLSKDLEEVSA